MWCCILGALARRRGGEWANPSRHRPSLDPTALQPRSAGALGPIWLTSTERKLSRRYVERVRRKEQAGEFKATLTGFELRERTRRYTDKVGEMSLRYPPQYP
jgi:hypothetical protein